MGTGIKLLIYMYRAFSTTAIRGDLGLDDPTIFQQLVGGNLNYEIDKALNEVGTSKLSSPRLTIHPKTLFPLPALIIISPSTAHKLLTETSRCHFWQGFKS
jgi:hypothetical protein